MSELKTIKQQFQEIDDMKEQIGKLQNGMTLLLGKFERKLAECDTVLLSQYKELGTPEEINTLILTSRHAEELIGGAHRTLRDISEAHDNLHCINNVFRKRK